MCIRISFGREKLSEAHSGRGNRARDQQGTSGPSSQHDVLFFDKDEVVT